MRTRPAGIPLAPLAVAPLALRLAVAAALAAAAAGLAADPLARTTAEPVARTTRAAVAVSSAETPGRLLVAEAVTALERDLAAQKIPARVGAAEEGSFMLGAYPRSLVLWRIRLEQPAAEEQLERIADAARHLRPGWVWISVPDHEGGAARLHAYPADGGDDR